MMMTTREVMRTALNDFGEDMAFSTTARSRRKI